MAKSFSIKLAPSAIDDLKEAILWYESRLVEGLAQKFMTHVDVSLSQLATVPGKGSIRYSNIRCSPVNKFPYLIHYEIEVKTKSIIVYRIFCTYRKQLSE